MPTARNPSAAVPAERPRASGVELKVLWVAGLTLATSGIVLRLQRFFLGRSFRGDEAALALAIENHSFLSLISKPLGGHLTAPVSFLGVEKLMVDVFGTRDFVFRLLPLLAGLCSVVLMYLLARRLVGGVGALLCIGAFSLNWVAAFYASDLKQYSSDILFALATYWAAARFFESDSPPNALILAVTGLLAMSFSHPAIFLLACVGPVLILRYRRDAGSIRHVVAMCLLWASMFVVLYIVFYRAVGQQPYIVDYWNDLNGLMPVPPWKDWSWFVIRTNSFLTTVMMFSRYTAVYLVLYTLGLFSFVRRSKWQWAVWLFGSALMTLLASAVANYPFKGRLILFLIPGTLLVIGEGVEWVGAALSPQPLLKRTAVWLLVLVMLWTPGHGLFNWLQQPRSAPYPEDIKPALAFIQSNKQASDLILVYHEAAPTYRYYAPFFGLSGDATIYLPDYRKNPDKYRGIIDVLPRNQRTWLVFSAVVETKGSVDEQTYMMDYVRATDGDVIAAHSVSGGISSAQLVIMR